MAKLKGADRKVLLNAPVTPSGLFGDAVESIIVIVIIIMQSP